LPYEINQESPLTQIAGLAAAYFKYKNMFDQQKLENDRIKQQGQQTTQDISASKTEQAAKRQEYGLGPNDQPLPSPTYSPLPTAQKGKPAPSDTDMFHAYMARYGQAVQNHDPNAPAFLQMAQQYSLGADRQSNEQYRQSESQYIQGPKTQLTNAQIRNTSGKFQHDIDMLRMRGVTAEQIARIHAAYRRAGGGRSGTGTAAAAAEQRAMYAALNEASHYGVNAQNALQDSIYRYGADLHASDPDNNPAPAAPQMIPMPVYIPGPNGQPTTIYVNAQGQIEKPQTPGARGLPPPGNAPRSSAPAMQHSSQPQQSGILNWIHDKIFGGGGGGSQHLTAKSKSGKPIHSDDGGKTWQAGP
jgi:hypothetical protein